MRSVGASHIGKVRTENQDRIFFHDQPVGNLKNLYIVADGMGGHRAGGHASSFAVERFVQLIEESKQTDPIELMKSSIASVNQEMYGSLLVVLYISESGKVDVVEPIVKSGKLYEGFLDEVKSICSQWKFRSGAKQKFEFVLQFRK